ncbi:MAG: hypothetical protein OXF42_04700 [Candidatus Dadabacteria bacterium]|nr:hypothetical protein [Candidatus Dadabacteria bacterium]
MISQRVWESNRDEWGISVIPCYDTESRGGGEVFRCRNGGLSLECLLFSETMTGGVEKWKE